MKTLWLVLSIVFGVQAHAAVEYSDVRTPDGAVIQTCARFPDPAKFPGPRPVFMLILGSGLYDTCRAKTAEGDYADKIVGEGVIFFVRQKRGIRHNPTDNTFTSDIPSYRQDDLDHLRTDTLVAFEHLLTDPRVDRSKIAVWGGSEGTIMATYLGQKYPEIKDVALVSSMVEDFPNLYARQMYVLLPQQIIQTYDKDGNKLLSKSEISDSELTTSGLASFDEIDTDHNGYLDEQELSSEVKRVIAKSLAQNDDTFFLSDWGGTITANWVKSAMLEKPLGPEILNLTTPTFVYHGTADTNALVQPVYDLQNEAQKLGKTNLKFTYFQGLTHELTKDVLVQLMYDSVDRVIQLCSDVLRGPTE